MHPPEETILDWVEKARWFKRDDKKAIADMMMTIHNEDPVGGFPAHRQRFKVKTSDLHEFALV